MKRVRKTKSGQPKNAEPESTTNSSGSVPTWQSVIAEAEERMAEARRLIDWAQKSALKRVQFGTQSDRDEALTNSRLGTKS